MYDVYTMERPGRPRLAVGLTAAVLTATVVFAWAIVLHKQRTTYVSLAPIQRVASWPVSIQLPEGWKSESLKNAPTEVGILLREPGRTGRSLAVVRGPVLDSALPPAYAVASVDDLVLWFSGAEVAKRIAQETASFGPLPGIEVHWLAGHRRRPMEQVLGTIGVTPQGQIFAILLKCPGRPDRNDQRFLRQLAATAEFPGAGLTNDIAAAARTCGLRLDAPPGTKATAPADGPVKTLRLVSAPTAQKAWTLALTLTPLAPGRTPQALLTDVVRNLTEDPTNSATIEPVKAKDHEAYRVRFSSPNQPWNGEVWVVPLDPQSVLLLNGRDEGPDSDLTAACQQIAETAALVDGAKVTDVNAAQRRGEELLADIRTKHVDEWFDNWAGADQILLITRAGQTEGYFRLRYSRLSEDNNVWRVESEDRRMLDGYNVTRKRDSRVDRSGVGYRLAEVRRALTAGGRPVSHFGEPYQYQESREPRKNSVRKTLAIAKQTYESSFDTTPSFAADPVLGIVYWLAAGDPQRRPVLVMSSDCFDTALTGQILYPLGEQPIPGSEPPQKALAVVVQNDSATSVYTIYFDSHGGMACVDFGHETTFQRCTEEEFRERFSLVPGPALSPSLIR